MEFGPLTDYQELFEVQYTSEKQQPGAAVWSGDWDNRELSSLVPKVLRTTLYMLQASARRLQTPPHGPVASIAYREWVAVNSGVPLERDFEAVLGQAVAPERYGEEWDTARLLMFTHQPFTAWVVTWYTRDEQNRGYQRGEVRLTPNPGGRVVLYETGADPSSMLDRMISN